MANLRVLFAWQASACHHWSPGVDSQVECWGIWEQNLIPPKFTADLVWTVLDQGLSFCFGRWLVDVVWTRSWKGGRRPRHVLARSVEPWIFPIKTHWVSNCNYPCPSCDFQLSRTWLSEKWDDSCSLAHFSCFHVQWDVHVVMFSCSSSQCYFHRYDLSKRAVLGPTTLECGTQSMAWHLEDLDNALPENDQKPWVNWRNFAFTPGRQFFLHKKRVELRSVQHTLWTVTR